MYLHVYPLVVQILLFLDPKTHENSLTKRLNCSGLLSSLSQMKEQITFTLRVFELSDEILSVIFSIKVLARRNLLIDCIVQWLTRSPDTREIPSSSLGIVIFNKHFTQWLPTKHLLFHEQTLEQPFGISS